MKPKVRDLVEHPDMYEPDAKDRAKINLTAPAPPAEEESEEFEATLQ